MVMNQNYGDDENPIILKSEFILSLVEQLVGTGKLNAKEKSLIDRCTANVYRSYIANGFEGTPPTLKDFRQELLRQDEPEAREVALAIELFTDGSLNTFAQQTNVNVDSQYLVYDIKDLGKQLRTIGMLVVLDNIFNRITANREKGRHTFIYIDEIYLLFQNEYSSNFLFELWKRVRKYGACATGVTQNVSDLLVSHTARTMLANSEFLLLMNQAPTDRIELANLINISEAQLSHITDNEKAGIGLLKYAGSIVPFEDDFPRSSSLFKLMSTTMGE
jgi:type IV secretory pathway VirB4 component